MSVSAAVCLCKALPARPAANRRAIFVFNRAQLADVGRRSTIRQPGAVDESLETEATSASTPTREDYSLFVHFLHLASPYVVGHRGRTFVIVIPGEIIVDKDLLHPLLEDILLLHGLGIRLVLVCGAQAQIDAYLRERGRSPLMVGAYRVTDEVALQGAIEAAGTTCTEIAAYLSRAPALPMVRRHSRSEGKQMHFAPPVQVINGNYVTAKRRGIVGDVDFQHMGQVRFVQVDAIRQQLQTGAIVVLTNIGVSASGELLNCNKYDVATHAAVELQADKLLCMTGEDVRRLNLPQYLPLDDAVAMIQQTCSSDYTLSSLDMLDDDGHPGSNLSNGSSANGSTRATAASGSGSGSSNGTSSSGGGGGGGGRHGSSAAASSSGRRGAFDASELNLDLDSWSMIGFPNAVLAAVVACKHGVTRTHLIDKECDGALLLELYTRDGTDGVCMIAGDIYQGIRTAEPRDAGAITSLLRLVQEAQGLVLPFDPEDLGGVLQDITVIERDGKVLGCCVCRDHGVVPGSRAHAGSSSSSSDDEAVASPSAAAASQPLAGDYEAEEGLDERVAELLAFVVHPSYRRSGWGDSLLDYVEQVIRLEGYQRVVIVAGQGSYEWFENRGFRRLGDARASPLLPTERRAQLRQGSTLQLLLGKKIVAAGNNTVPAGKRIGF